MRTWKRLIAVAAATLATATPAKETLYATSVRSQVEGGDLIAGNLYRVDPSTAAAQLVGSIRVGDSPVGVIAIAEHPLTHIVYGINVGLSRTVPRSILEIDLDKASASIVAPLPVRGSDIGFAPDGTLYMWASELHRLVRLDPRTGNVTPVGEPLEGTAGGALAISLDGKEAIVAANGAAGRLYRIDVHSGFITPGPELSDAPYDASIDNLTYSASGELYAVNSDGGVPAKAALVTVDAHIGLVTRIGPLPDDVRGLIFATERPAAVSPDRLRLWILASLGLIALVLIAYAVSRK
jgi:hypothetical protein